MFSHVMVGTNDMEKSKAFYDATFAELGYAPGMMDEKGRCFYVTKTGVFSITKPINGESATHGNGSTIGFSVENADMANAWHAAGIANGGVTCEEPPGEREGSLMKLYIAYLRDPAGNKICAVHRM
ncbi:VOC family protein [Photobacterium sanguinicancri]|uniref:VOC family protein n=1 Tax=Photobacterium sanguinicancri TaxID=875932 RepID=A0AAW7Y3K2_9GAMM|nr:VOC family protein [Photobacterium sanguinicancri]KXI21255.1 glyoxalase [Photobacterium sanguinicancri]MDO6541533.1 VOC family protein [Photobacterium sanguinicancri]OZS45946.1 VOC family protein [Photobacterium sanguinicancri]